MDVSDSANEGTNSNIQVWSDNGSDNQRYYIYQLDNAYYIKPVCIDLVLDMDMNNYPRNVAVWDKGVDWNPQKFDIEKIDPNIKKTRRHQ